MSTLTRLSVPSLLLLSACAAPFSPTAPSDAPRTAALTTSRARTVNVETIDSAQITVAMVGNPTQSTVDALAASVGATVVEQLADWPIWVMELPSKSVVEAAVNTLLLSSQVEDVGVDEYLTMDALTQPEYAALIGTVSWHHVHTGATNADVTSTYVWPLTEGNLKYRPMVAVLDSMFRSDHTDLQANWAVNAGESCTDPYDLDYNGNLGGDGVDNDGNGKIDDCIGWNTKTGTNHTWTAPATVGATGCGHGTMVAGVVAASVQSTGSNAAGIAPAAELLPIGIGSYNTALNKCQIATVRAQRAVAYAKSRGADIIIGSFGHDGPNGNAWPQTLANAHADGVLTVWSAGNNNTDMANPAVPANWHWPAVAAHGIDYLNGGAAPDLTRDLGFSITSYGSNNMYFLHNYSPVLVDMAAPGRNVYTTGAGQPNRALSVSGTSLAAPAVAGALALVMSAYPDLDAADIAESVRMGNVPVSNASPCVRSWSCARLDVAQAMMYAGDISYPGTSGVEVLTADPTSFASIPQPGERFGLDLTLANLGSVDALAVDLEIACDAKVTVEANAHVAGDILHHSLLTQANAFTLQVEAGCDESQGCVPGDTASCTVTATDSLGTVNTSAISLSLSYPATPTTRPLSWWAPLDCMYDGTRPELDSVSFPLTIAGTVYPDAAAVDAALNSTPTTTLGLLEQQLLVARLNESLLALSNVTGFDTDGDGTLNMRDFNGDLINESFGEALDWLDVNLSTLSAADQTWWLNALEAINASGSAQGVWFTESC